MGCNNNQDSGEIPTEVSDSAVTESPRRFVVVDFGRVTPGSTERQTVQLRNELQSAVEVEDFIVPCGCTVPIMPIRKIPGNSSGSIEIEFKAGNDAEMSEKIFL